MNALRDASGKVQYTPCVSADRATLDRLAEVVIGALLAMHPDAFSAEGGSDV